MREFYWKKVDIFRFQDHFDTRDRDESLNSNLAIRPESAISNDLENDHENSHLNPRVINSGNCAESDRNSVTANSSAVIKDCLAN